MFIFDCPACGNRARIREGTVEVLYRCRECKARIKFIAEAKKAPFNHVFHCLATFCTGGLWLPLWLLAYYANPRQKTYSARLLR